MELTQTQKIGTIASEAISFMHEMGKAHPNVHIHPSITTRSVMVNWNNQAVTFGLEPWQLPFDEAAGILNRAAELSGWEPRFNLPEWA